MKTIQRKIKELNKRRGFSPDNNLDTLREICTQLTEAKEQLMLTRAKEDAGPDLIKHKASQVVFYALQFFEAMDIEAPQAMQEYFDYMQTRFKDNDEGLHGLNKNEFDEYFKTNEKGMLI